MQSDRRGEHLADEFGARRGERRYNAFTLIELVLVVGIVTVLAGLVLSTVGYARKKAARARAETEIAAISAACENYKADNGVYPSNSDTNTLNLRRRSIQVLIRRPACTCTTRYLVQRRVAVLQTPEQNRILCLSRICYFPPTKTKMFSISKILSATATAILQSTIQLRILVHSGV